MFNNYPEEKQKHVQECRPNYEEIASRLKKRIDADKQCLSGMKDGVNFGSVDLNNDQRVLYYAIIGVLSVTIPKHEKEYEILLKKIEEEK